MTDGQENKQPFIDTFATKKSAAETFILTIKIFSCKISLFQSYDILPARVRYFILPARVSKRALAFAGVLF